MLLLPPAQQIVRIRRLPIPEPCIWKSCGKPSHFAMIWIFWGGPIVVPHCEVHSHNWREWRPKWWRHGAMLEQRYQQEK